MEIGEREEGEEGREREKDCNEWGLGGDRTSCLVHHPGPCCAKLHIFKAGHYRSKLCF